MTPYIKDFIKTHIDLLNSEEIKGLHAVFNSDHEGAVVPEGVSEDNIIGIIMQDWFKNLVHDDNGFSVVLSFRNKERDVYVPFDSIIRFMEKDGDFLLILSNPKPQKEEEEESEFE